MNTIPLFPLNTVLFPEGELQLRLFEPRYIDMVSSCMRIGSGFGICLIQESNEAGVPAEVYSMGTYVSIIDWDKLEDGLLGITVRGDRRFRVEKTDIQDNNLYVAEVSYLNENDDSMPDSYQGFSNLLKEIANRYELPFAKESDRYEDANWVSERLAEILPFEITAKQALLEMNNALRRLDYMQVLLEKIDAGETNQS